MGNNLDGEKISNDEKVADICLLINVFDHHKEEEKLILKALNDFDCVYGKKYTDMAAMHIYALLWLFGQ